MSANEDFPQRDTRPLQRFSLDLFIIHPTMHPDIITKNLELKPQIIHPVGEQRIASNGKLLSGKYPDTRWRHCVYFETKRQHFSEQITQFSNRLIPY